jgi:hypothetical protein
MTVRISAGWCKCVAVPEPRVLDIGTFAFGALLLFSAACLVSSLVLFPNGPRNANLQPILTQLKEQCIELR